MVQRSSTTAFAKSTRPEIGGVVRREPLFARLDGTPARTVVWVSAPPGFGKTTLAASYLEARSHRWAWYQVDPDDDDGETFFLGGITTLLGPGGRAVRKATSSESKAGAEDARIADRERSL